MHPKGWREEESDRDDASAQEVRSPLEIDRQGWLFAGGRIDESIADRPMVGHLYAEYQIPHRRRRPFPVVMIHGGRQSGTNFTGTPDGREGWAQFFLRQGYAVYVVDQPGRGRAAYHPEAYGPLSFTGLTFTQQRFVNPEAFGMWPQAHLHSQWPGSGKPGDPSFDAFFASQQPSIADFAKQQHLMRDAGAALLDEIGPAVLLVHSQAGAFAWPIAQARPSLVKAIVAVEPSGPPAHTIINTGPPDWFRDDPSVRLSGLCDIPLEYEPPLPPGGRLEFVPNPAPPSQDRAQGWLQKEPARRLKHLDAIPVVVVTADASWHTSYDANTVDYLRQAGVNADHVRLADLGICGNGHMMMLEKNNLEIAKVLTDWLGDRGL